MPKNNNRNTKQDIQIAKLSTTVNDLKERFNKFVDNEFPHFKNKIENRIWWIIGLVIIGILIPILLSILK